MAPTILKGLSRREGEVPRDITDIADDDLFFPEGPG